MQNSSRKCSEFSSGGPSGIKYLLTTAGDLNSLVMPFPPLSSFSLLPHFLGFEGNLQSSLCLGFSSWRDPLCVGVTVKEAKRGSQLPQIGCRDPPSSHRVRHYSQGKKFLKMSRALVGPAAYDKNKQTNNHNHNKKSPNNSGLEKFLFQMKDVCLIGSQEQYDVIIDLHSKLSAYPSTATITSGPQEVLGLQFWILGGSSRR